MRIASIAPGSRGDVEPYLALGKGLTKVGYEDGIARAVAVVKQLEERGTGLAPNSRLC